MDKLQKNDDSIACALKCRTLNSSKWQKKMRHTQEIKYTWYQQKASIVQKKIMHTKELILEVEKASRTLQGRLMSRKGRMSF